MLNFERNASAMRRLLRLIIIAGSCAVPFALAQKTTVDWHHNVTDFSSFKTYAWSKPVRPTPNPLMDQRIVAAIDSQLAGKGLQKRESGGDLLVTYSAGVRRETSAVATGMGGWRMGGGMGRIDPIVENQGTLVVDLSSGQNKNLLWRGTAADTLSDSPDKNTKKIEKAVEKMFKNYPPKKK
jgi:hypothetical protein